MVHTSVYDGSLHQLVVLECLQVTFSHLCHPVTELLDNQATVKSLS